MKRSALVLGSLLALAARTPAQPSDAGAPAHSAPRVLADPGVYNQAMVDTNELLVQRLQEADRQLASLPPIARFESFRLEALAAAREAHARVEAIAELPHDQGFRAAVLENFAAFERIFGATLPEVFDLYNKERVRNADLARLEALHRDVEETADRCAERVLAAQRAFAQSAGFRLRASPSPPEPPPEPTFTAPGIPPAGSALDGEVHVAFAMRYASQAVEFQRALASSANRAVAATRGTPADLEAARQAELEQVRTERELAEAFEAWQGDDSLRAGAIEMAKQLERVLRGPLKSLARQLAKGVRSQAEADRANALGQEIDAGVQQAFDAFGAGERRFRARWAFDAYEAWETAHPPEPLPAPPADDSPHAPAPRPLPPEPGPAA